MVLMSIEGLDVPLPCNKHHLQLAAHVHSAGLTAQWALHNNQAKVGPSTAGRREEGGIEGQGGRGERPRGINPTPFCLCLYPPYHPSMCNFNRPRMNYSGLHTGCRLFTIHLLKCIFLTGLTTLAIGNINGVE